MSSCGSIVWIMTRTNGNGKSESKSAKARRLAAERMAAAVERVRLNQADLETVLAGAEQIAEAERRRDRAIARARRDFAEAEAKAQRGIGQAITAWRARGESEQTIAEVSGLTVGAVRKLALLGQSVKRDEADETRAREVLDETSRIEGELAAVGAHIAQGERDVAAGEQTDLDAEVPPLADGGGYSGPGDVCPDCGGTNTYTTPAGLGGCSDCTADARRDEMEEAGA